MEKHELCKANWFFLFVRIPKVSLRWEHCCRRVMRLVSGSEKLRAAFSFFGPWSCSAGCFHSFSNKSTTAWKQRGRIQFGASFWISEEEASKAWKSEQGRETATTASRERLVQYGALLTAAGGSYGVSYMRWLWLQPWHCGIVPTFTRRSPASSSLLLPFSIYLVAWSIVAP